MITVSKLIAQIEEEQTLLEKEALRRPASDFAEYQKRVGIFSGLQIAINILRNTTEKDE